MTPHTLLQKESSIIAHNEYSNSTLLTDKGAIKIMGLAYKFFIVYRNIASAWSID